MLLLSRNLNSYAGQFISSFATGKARSDGAEEAGTAKYSLAMRPNRGNNAACTNHQVTGLQFKSAKGMS